MGIELSVFEIYLLSLGIVFLVVVCMLFTWWLREKLK